MNLKQIKGSKVLVVNENEVYIPLKSFTILLGLDYSKIANQVVKHEILGPVTNIRIHGQEPSIKDYLDDPVFEDWANNYFSIDGPNVNAMLIKRIVQQDYIDQTDSLHLTINKFTRKLKSWANKSSWVESINPTTHTNAQGRILRRIAGELQEMVFMQTI